MTDQETSELAQAIQEVSEKASLLVREEIALAKAELTQKLTGLARGAAIGAFAGVFAVFALIYFFHFVALALDALFGVDLWVGYLIVFVLLMVLAAVAGFTAARLFRKGTPPTPQMAIEEAQLIKATLTAPHPATPSSTVERAEANR
jgi:uncharacterized membrane protein YqjE